MTRKIWITALLVVVVGISAGCGQKPQTAAAPDPAPKNSSTAGNTDNSLNSFNAAGTSNTSTGGAEQQGTAQGTVDSADPKPETLTIDAYYTDDQMLELKKVQKEIKPESGQDKYGAALKSLQSSGDSKLYPLWEKVNFKSASLQDGMLTVDIHLPDEARLGAGGESLALDALKKTVFQFDEVKSLELLIDGQKTDTLMGHVELTHPLTRE
ncbi:GerMN domain-containing protein [Paenibacillus sp. YPG26]|uniref:GerMN domain-containing protein n=1 Tax=Paenibacillus sp. YPG26 TaxID=2878915 RepID=UPI00203AA873|nr:GerMN domain-containing protein [Paenibacillus sp. YPG26]USB34829.1 GerMN domain-containing protein [Paenibacillus sp. YPG26]